MRRQKKRILGKVITDARVPVPYRQKAQNAGWFVKKVKEIHSESSDKQIAKIYGQNRYALLTSDKLAHTHNVKNGFIGYIYIDGKISPEEDSDYLKKFYDVISTVDKKTVKGHIVHISKEKTGYDRKKFLKKQSES